MGQRWLEEKEHATFVCQFSNLLIRNGIIVQLAFWCLLVCGEQHACTCIANIFKWANDEGQHVCRAIGVVLRHQTTVVFRAKGKGPPPPPPRWLTQRGIGWEARHKYFATQRFQHLWHLFVCRTAITCHKVAPTLLSPSLALMLGSTTYPEHCSENISPKRTRKQRAVRGMLTSKNDPPHADCPPSRPPPSSPCSPPPPWGAFNWGAGEWGPAPL